jgi:hypothetical protein
MTTRIIVDVSIITKPHVYEDENLVAIENKHSLTIYKTETTGIGSAAKTIYTKLAVYKQWISYRIEKA